MEYTEWPSLWNYTGAYNMCKLVNNRLFFSDERKPANCHPQAFFYLVLEPLFSSLKDHYQQNLVREDERDLKTPVNNCFLIIQKEDSVRPCNRSFIKHRVRRNGIPIKQKHAQE